MRIIVVVTALLISPLAAPCGPTVYLQPAETTVVEGDSFELGIRVDAGTDTITCFLVDFVFDSAVVGLTSAIEGTLFAECGYQTMFSWDVYSPGSHSCNDVTLGHWAYAICPGELIHLQFDALAVGETSMDVVAVDLRDINRDPVPDVSFCGGVITVTPQTDVDALPDSSRRLRLFPNPFRDSLTIDVDPFEGSEGVRILIYDVSGRVVRCWNVDATSGGSRQPVWDGVDLGGARCPSGVYFVVARGGGLSSRSRVVLLR